MISLSDFRNCRADPVALPGRVQFGKSLLPAELPGRHPHRLPPRLLSQFADRLRLREEEPHLWKQTQEPGLLPLLFSQLRHHRCCVHRHRPQVCCLQCRSPEKLFHPGADLDGRRPLHARPEDATDTSPSRHLVGSSSVLLTLLNLMILVDREGKLEILDIVEWAMSFLLLLCAFRLTRNPPPGTIPDQGLSEPLLYADGGETKTEISMAGFWSRLAFSWLNPLLRSEIQSASSGSAGGHQGHAVSLAEALVLRREKGRMKMRSSVMAAVFQKQLKLSSVGRRNHSTGEIVNYIAVDAYRLGEFPWWFHYGWSLTLQLVSAIVILLVTVGVGALPGLVPLLLCATLNTPGNLEALNNMKIIKLQSWEEKFRATIQALRDVEFKYLSGLQIMKSYGSVLYWMSPILVSAVIFAGCVATGSAPLNAGTIFTVLATLKVMAEPMRMLPEVISALIQMKVSLDRLDRFLLEDEIKEEDVQRRPVYSSELGVRIRKGEFRWDPAVSVAALRNVDVEVQRGHKLAVCGPVGAGKSSLLQAILGELNRVSGSVEVFGSIAYVSQTSWIQSGTIRDNILYGKPMEETRYEMVIRSCALDKDIDSFDHGDLTEIGQRGLNMSGGQKQRIQLARAVYSDADVFLLDDPFSAVDAHTAAVLFNDCVLTALRSKTVVLVTHQIEFLSQVDRILELLEVGTAFEQLVSAHESERYESPDILETRPEAQPNDRHQQKAEDASSITNASKIQLTEDETKDGGNLGWKPYVDYVSFSNGFLHLVLIILFQSGFVLLQSLSTFWLAYAIRIPNMGNITLVGVYTALSSLSGVAMYTRSLLSTHLGLKASMAFFSGLMESLFRAPMAFFDSTPVGRILTRASSDMSILDYDIPYALCFSLSGILEVMATVLVMAVVTWQILIVAVPVTIAVRYYQTYYLSSAREIVRINGTTKAPLTNHAAETSLGAVTIRAFSDGERSVRRNMELINTDASQFFHSIAAMEWLLLRVESLQNITVVAAAVFLLLLPKESGLPRVLNSLVLQLGQLHYLCGTDQAVHADSIGAPATIEARRPPPQWPAEGRIDLEDLKIKYRPNAPLVLKGITCTFAAGHKVGVVGRTGSGKTTLISALFRVVDPAGGRILVDGLDICSIGLKDLRMHLSIIPQEPSLFRGSVRSNLDPLGLHTDHEIWEALEKCQLKKTIASLPDLLDSSVSDEGDNWSAGQRQLFCLGRVLLRRNRILVLDEATASIDSATDATLQRIIKQEFGRCTVITVAHRVPTVVESDMILVLSFGSIVEYDVPSRLMAESGSAFSKLVAEYWSSWRRSNSSQNLFTG
ncbi:unnamed protein product [Spirodela intermedia]|uniref:Uncharacterized protein n=1 Tax=Spirodela intermedia TaxID=51605 RepID=A0A7I8JRN1_SPIIN|nr:unnamed protein product [Spirodela intermedia]CAA6672830.1 unnamed protein product [Spirodela intermedia]